MIGEGDQASPGRHNTEHEHNSDDRTARACTPRRWYLVVSRVHLRQKIYMFAAWFGIAVVKCGAAICCD